MVPDPQLPLSTYEPLSWLLRDDIADQLPRGRRRKMYRKLLRQLAAEFDNIYGDRLVASNGLWDFSQVYLSAENARNCIRRMRWCAWAHFFHFAGASACSIRAYNSIFCLS